MIVKHGISASPGVAIGPALILDTEEYRIPRRTVDPAQTPGQVRAFDAAITSSRQEITELRAAAARKLGENAAAIFAFHEAVIADPKLRASVVDLLERYHYTAAYAFGQVLNQKQREFRNTADDYFRERVRDLYDIEKRVLRHILGRQREDITRLSEPVIIVAHDLTPSQAIAMDPTQVLGFAVNVGGSTSHTAIIARALGIPAVVALNDITSDVSGGETIIVDGTHGVAVANPDAATLEKYSTQQREYRAFERELLTLRDQPAVTLDGEHITLLANIELADESRAALDAGAEGIGLYRSEFLFLAGPRVPSEEQQYEAFRVATRHARQRPIVIRTIDLGADKLASALGFQHDQNPAMGLRSLRYCLRNLDLFRAHLRAILRASAEGDLRIMFPMITSLIELRQARATLNDVMEDLEEEGIPFRRDIPVGMMVETPAAALLIQAFAREVAFVSIGTNDLTQYTLAVDRANERVSDLYATHSPAVLRLIRHVVRAANRARISVSLCGEMAGAPIYCQLLLGLGLRQLSMSPKDIDKVKKLIRSTSLTQCRSVARRALSFDSDRQVLNFLRDELQKVMPEEM